MLYIIAGTHKNRRIKTPKNQETRPTTSRLREALFNICQNYIEGVSFLDIFAGSGAMGLEALSRGAKRATFIDCNRECTHCIRENLTLLGMEEKGKILLGDAISLLERLERQRESFDIIYMDPPYETEGLPHKLIEMIDQSRLLLPRGMLFIEESKAALIDKKGWLTLNLKSIRQMGRSQLLQFEKYEK